MKKELAIRLFFGLSMLVAVFIIACGGDSGNHETTASISGYVRFSSGQGVANVRVSTSNPYGTVSTLTNQDGYWIITEQSDGAYTMTPSLSGYTFIPANRGVTLSGVDVTDVNFTASQTGVYRILGRITENSQYLSNITVRLTGTSSMTTTTSSSGLYEFTGLIPGNYIIQPENNDYYFYPEDRAVEITNSSLTGQTFFAENKIIEKLDAPRTKTVTVNFHFPTGCPLDTSTLTMYSLVGESNYGVSDQLLIIDEGIPQMILVEDENENLVYWGHVPVNEIGYGSVHLRTIDFVKALFYFFPQFVLIGNELDKEALFNDITAHPDYSELYIMIERALVESPYSIADYDSYPGIYDLAGHILLETIIPADQRSTSMSTASGEVGIRAIVIGEDNDPHVDTSPNRYTFELVNPKMVFWGVDVIGTEFQQEYLIPGRSGYRSWMIFLNPPVDWQVPHDQIDHGIRLPDGDYDITFIKGKGGFNSAKEAESKAAKANSLKSIVLALDAIGVPFVNDNNFIMVLTGQPGRTTDGEADYLLGRFGATVGNIAIQQAGLDPESLLLRTVEWLGDGDVYDGSNLQLVMHAFYKVPGINGRGWWHFAKKSQKTFKTAAKALKRAFAIYGAANETIPFFWQTFTTPNLFNYGIRMSNGYPIPIDSQVAPKPSVVVSNSTPAIGETITLDASGTTDDSTPLSQLQFSWDMNGDGDFIDPIDINGPNLVLASFAEPKEHTIILRVTDSDGLEAFHSVCIYVGSFDEAYKFILRWGENPSDLDFHLYTPNIEGQAYHVYYSQPYRDLGQAPYVMLDVDDRTGFGPEKFLFERLFPGTYKLSVHLYAGSGSLPTSGAIVEVIDPDGFSAGIFPVPASGSGSYWHVLEFDGTTKVITPVNIINNSSTF